MNAPFSFSLILPKHLFTQVFLFFIPNILLFFRDFTAISGMGNLPTLPIIWKMDGFVPKFLLAIREASAYYVYTW